MLLRYSNTKMVTSITTNVVRAKMLTGSGKGQDVFISSIDLNTTEGDLFHSKSKTIFR